jgi:predicted site-specific integrase-resolvase
MAGAGMDRCFGIERASQHWLTVVYRRVSRHGQQVDLESQRRTMEHIARDEIGILIVATGTVSAASGATGSNP